MIKVLNLLVKTSFKDIKNFDNKKSHDISKFIMDSILNLPWFLKFPISIYLHILEYLIIFKYLKPVGELTYIEQYYFYKSIFKKLPFSNSIDKLIRTLGFMRLYDG